MTCPYLKKCETNICNSYPSRPIVIDLIDLQRFCLGEHYVDCPTYKQVVYKMKVPL